MNCKVRQARMEDLPEVKRLIDENISRDFYSMADLERMLHTDDDLLYVVVDEDRDNIVVAYFYAFLATLAQALRLLHISALPQSLQDISQDERIGVFKTSSTDPAYRNKGLFSWFMENLQEILRQKGARMIIATALKPYGKDVPIRNTLQRTGFVAAETLHSPWKTVRGYCPYCKKEYCICNAVIYIRKFEA